MEKLNSYSLTFGKEPFNMISRLSETDEICKSFLAEVSPQQVYMLTGVRGAGKTVQMTELSNRISREDNWETVELNPSTDILQDMASKLYSLKGNRDIFKNAKFDLSFWGIGVQVAGAPQITNAEVAITEMLETLKKHKKRLLITIDEATNSDSMKAFASAFQIFLRKELPVYLLMTGLYENIDALQNNKSLTFLHRAPKIFLGALNIGSIVRNYKKMFNLTDDQAREMAGMTKGYSFAFQVLGYWTYENGGDYKKAMDKYLEYLEEYSYKKIWSEMSFKEKSILEVVSRVEGGKVAEIREKLGMKPNEFSPYRERLIRRGILLGDDRGIVKIALQYIEEYVLNIS